WFLRILGGKNILNASRLIDNQSSMHDERFAYLMSKVIERNHLSTQFENALNEFYEAIQIKIDALDREIDILIKNYILLH
ncbi:MAG TPA: hypothetical protein VFM18_01430, partial [Methanosarcina sp.]|nr:hypothetical protein [Methanosarcina sp.]